MQRHRQLSLGSFSKQISEHFEFCLKKHSVTGAPPPSSCTGFSFPSTKGKCGFSELLFRSPQKYTKYEQEWEIHIPDPSLKRRRFGAGPFVWLCWGPRWAWGMGGFTVGGWGGAVCSVKSHLLPVFLKQSRCVTVWWKPPSHRTGLCNHHRRTCQQSGSITHPHKQTLMSVNEARTPTPEGWDLAFVVFAWWRQTMQLYAGERTGKWQGFFCPSQTLQPGNFPSVEVKRLYSFVLWSVGDFRLPSLFFCTIPLV